MKHYLTTKEMTNTFPLWSDTRSEEQSIGYRLFNSFASEVDPMRKMLDKQSSNTYLKTFDPNELDILYRIGYENEPTSLSGNNVNNISFVEDISGILNAPFARISNPSIKDHVLIGSGIYSSPTSSRIAFDPNQDLGGEYLYLSIKNSGNYIEIFDTGFLPGEIFLKGTDYLGKEYSESLPVLFDGIAKTRTLWDSLEEIRCSYFTYDLSTIEIKTKDYFLERKPIFYRYRVNDRNQNLDTFISIDGQYLVYSALAQKNFNEIVSTGGQVTYDKLQEHHIEQNLIDIVHFPYKDLFVGLTSNKIYLYDSYPKLISLEANDGKSNRSYDVNVDLFTEEGRDWYRLDEQATISTKLRRTESLITFCDISVYFPGDGEIPSYKDTRIPIVTKYIGDKLFPSVEITTSEIGKYIVELIIYYEDGTFQRNIRILEVLQKEPINAGGFDLNLPGGVTATSLAFDRDNKLWILASNDKEYEIEFHKDVAMMDTETQTIYFSDQYDDVVMA